ncbi:MAG: SMC-Scp complex subunit ScpB [Gemmatimonadaceae bacterium]|nr:SMC-Scp complex subunit ScpB [Gemmatimonadaceae bacterium]
MSGSLDPGELRGIVEAVLMTSDAPVSPGRLEAVVKGVKGSQLRQAVRELNESYREGGHAMTIVEIAGGYQVVTLKEFAPWLRKFHDRGHVRLSQAALETLAIVAFKQPVTRMEVDNLRGVDSAGVVRNLLELNLVRIVGRSEGIGRPMLFGTTRDFMTHFGLRSLADLPKPKELEELLAEGERKAHAGAENGQVESGPEEGQGPEADRPAEGLPAEGGEAEAGDPAEGPDPRAEERPEADLPEVGGRIEAEEELPEGGSAEDRRS